MNYQIAQPLDIDHMPAEVATEMLARGRLTNRQRKQCMQARFKIFGSGVPLRRRYVQEPDSVFLSNLTPSEVKQFHRDTPLVFDADFSPPTVEAKLARRFSTVPIDRLARQVARSIRARRRVQTAYAKLAGEESKKAVKLRRLLDLAAAHHEAVQDSAQETINARMKKCVDTQEQAGCPIIRFS